MANEKAVLISIRPKWCELIASGKKTIEVRKTAPKIQTPFKCYIYETQGETETPWMDEEGHMIFRGRGRVVGEFVCDNIYDICIEISKPDDLPGYPFPCTGLTDKEILKYLGNGRTGYGWHVSDLKIYDKPKALSEFYTWKKCNSCRMSGYESSACIYYEDCKVPEVVTRPPQIWGYVEEITDGK